MAFHVACPITSRTICYCTLGFPRELQNEKGQNGFLEEIAMLKAFWDDPWLIKDDKKTVQVLVPKVDVTPPPPQVTVTSNAVVVDGGPEDAADEMLSAQSKREAMQKKAAAASLVAEDYARRFESGDTMGVMKDVDGEEQVVSNGKVMCRLCFSGENERSVRARKMLSCKSCNKKYHRSCLKTWAHDRDLFHWTSWTCPSCRICEVCRRTGDPNKLMFCKRCDGAYHCYCQHPPHKNVSKGPYLCPKHTKCHSCASTVPGNGSSLRWFLGYTCCDACGRLFVKGNYCPVCLKVYRDSESTPMVCCDVCQRWVHCHCDGISDERYLQFQVDNHLQYSCATCRGECYQVRDLEDAVQELWRRRDKADQDLISSLRAAAGLPTQEEIFAISPYYSDEDDYTQPPLKKEYGHSLKFSLKGVIDKQSPNNNKKNKDSAKKSSKKYGKDLSFGSMMTITGENKDQDMQSYRNSEPELYKNKLVTEVSGTDSRFFKDKILKNHNRPNHMTSSVGETTGKGAVKSKDIKGRKLVIHLGSRHKTAINSPRSDASNSLVDQPLTAPPNGGEEDMVQQKPKDNYLDMLANSSKLSDVEGDNINHDDQTRISLGKRSTNRSVTPGSGSEKLKPSLRLKFKNPYSDDQSFVKGQRSKRKRPLTFTDKSSSFLKEEDNKVAGNSYDEIMDAKWIIQKLGKHAIGKIVEVHQQSSNFWHKGTIIEFCEDTSTVLVTLDDGKAMNVDLGKQGIRFVSKKQRQ